MCARCEEDAQAAEELWDIARSLDEIADQMFCSGRDSRRRDAYRHQAEIAREIAGWLAPEVFEAIPTELKKEMS